MPSFLSWIVVIFEICQYLSWMVHCDVINEIFFLCCKSRLIWQCHILKCKQLWIATNEVNKGTSIENLWQFSIECDVFLSMF
uniref:Uncharacterized protein n=1 Tax=Rhizophora mucronata TaxID=61149 RepID=A0A2P2NSF3_RHIMU